MEPSIPLALVIGVLSFLISLFTLPFLIRLMFKYGITGRDIHKPGVKLVAEMGGISLLIGFFLSSLLLALLLEGDYRNRALSFSFCILLVGIVGIIDDLRPLSGVVKPALLLIPAIPLYLFNTYDSTPVLPIVGEVQITIIYPILLLFVITVTSNAANMLDTVNGGLNAMGIILIIFCTIASFVVYGFDNSFLFICCISSLILGSTYALWLFNRNPAKVFNGDTGSLILGSSFGLLAVLGRIEFIVLIAMIPFIINAFSIIISAKGLKERRTISIKGTVGVGVNRIQGVKGKTGVITLTRLITSNNPLSDHDIGRSFIILTFTAGIFAIIIALTIRFISL